MDLLKNPFQSDRPQSNPPTSYYLTPSLQDPFLSKPIQKPVNPIYKTHLPLPLKNPIHDDQKHAKSSQNYTQTNLKETDFTMELETLENSKNFMLEPFFGNDPDSNSIQRKTWNSNLKENNALNSDYLTKRNRKMNSNSDIIEFQKDYQNNSATNPQIDELATIGFLNFSELMEALKRDSIKPSFVIFTPKVFERAFEKIKQRKETL